MNPITISLPVPPSFEDITPQESKNLISSRGVIWFPEEADRIIWMQALGTRPTDYLVLQTPGYQLHLRIFTDEVGLHRLPGDCLRLIYLPAKGLNDERYEKFFRSRDILQYGMRLFQPLEELGHHPNEESVLNELSAEASYLFHTAPFLGLADPSSYPLLREWLAAVVVQANLSTEKESLDYRLDTAQTRSIPLLTLGRSRIQRREDLLDLFRLSREGRQLLDEMKGVRARLKQVSGVELSLPKTIHDLAVEGTDETSQRVYKVPFVPTFGAELLPQQHKLLKKIREFASQLSSSQQEQLENKGKRLQQILSRPRALALIGAYSSGKTTLLNMLLLGEDGTRAFHTNRASNTAIISEISHVAPGGKEAVTFQFRRQVDDFVLATPGQTRSDITHQENIRELLDLEARRILYSPQIKIHAPTQTTLRSGSPPGERETYILDQPYNIKLCMIKLLEVAEDSSKDLPPELEQRMITFSASVDQALLRTYLIQAVPPRLIEAIDLSEPSGWEEFQGKPEGTRKKNTAWQKMHWTEAATASILVEVARVKLRNPLLELTTITDTPGTGSGNNGHDGITAKYLDQAEGFILLLSTDMVHHEGVREIMERLRDQMEYRYPQDPASGLASVAFVVNCFPTHGGQAPIGAIEQFKKLICNTFYQGRTDEWERLQNNERIRNFFVVQLKRVKEAGERPKKLYKYPSIIPLKEWVAALFRSRGYKERFNSFRNLIADEWEAEYRLLIKQRENLRQSEQKRVNNIKAIRSFLERELTSLAQPHLQEIRSFRHEFASQCTEVTTVMRSYSEDPIKLKPNDLEMWQRRMQTYYVAINERLKRFVKLQTAQAWAEEVQAKLRSLDVTPPSLFPPDPISENEHLSIYRMNREFEEMIQNWPRGLARIGQWFKRVFTSEEDTRIKYVRNVIRFWEHEYEDLYNPLETYLQQCESYITQGNTQIAKRCQEAISQAENTDLALRTQQVTASIARFDSFKKARQDVLHDLERELKRAN